VAQARGTARQKKPATAISQPKNLEGYLRNELIASPHFEPANASGRRRWQGRQDLCHVTTAGMLTRLLLLRAFG